MSEKYVIMFVCTGNTCRSPMAQGALQSLLEKARPGQVEVISSGVSAASDFPATAYAIEASKIWHCDITGHRSQPLTEEVIKRSDLILAMTESHLKQILQMDRSAADRTFLFLNFPDSSPHGEGVDDPIGQPLDRYNEVFLEIGEQLGKTLDEFVQSIDEKSSVS